MTYSELVQLEISHNKYTLSSHDVIKKILRHLQSIAIDAEDEGRIPDGKFPHCFDHNINESWE